MGPAAARLGPVIFISIPPFWISQSDRIPSAAKLFHVISITLHERASVGSKCPEDALGKTSWPRDTDWDSAWPWDSDTFIISNYE